MIRFFFEILFFPFKLVYWMLLFMFNCMKLVFNFFSGIYTTFFGYKTGGSSDGLSFEYTCASILRKRGFSNVDVTKGSGDQGIDVLAWKGGTKYGIQCKLYASPVGNKAVQEAYAGKTFYDCDKAAVMTNSTFTESAIELANKLGVELWDNTPTSPERKRNPIPFFLSLIVMGVYIYLNREDDEKIVNAFLYWCVFIAVYVFVTWLIRGAIRIGKTVHNNSSTEYMNEELKGIVSAPEYEDDYEDPASSAYSDVLPESVVNMLAHPEPTPLTSSAYDPPRRYVNGLLGSEEKLTQEQRDHKRLYKFSDPSVLVEPSSDDIYRGITLPDAAFRNILFTQITDNVQDEFIEFLIKNCNPDSVRLVICDSTGLSSQYNYAPQILRDAVVDGEGFEGMCEMLENVITARNNTMAAAHVKNIKAYNDLALDKRMPLILVFLTELYEQTTVASLRKSLTRVLWKGQQAGVHFYMFSKFSEKSLRLQELKDLVEIRTEEDAHDIINANFDVYP